MIRGLLVAGCWAITATLLLVTHFLPGDQLVLAGFTGLFLALALIVTAEWIVDR